MEQIFRKPFVWPGDIDMTQRGISAATITHGVSLRHRLAAITPRYNFGRTVSTSVAEQSIFLNTAADTGVGGV